MIIEVKPNVQHQSNCPYCYTSLKPKSIFWQGMYVCAKFCCTGCNANLVEELKIGHAINSFYQIDLLKGVIFGQESGKNWLGYPLLHSLQAPQAKKVEVSKEIFKQCNKVLILNCIDFLYGHCLLKLLNASVHLEGESEYGLVAIVQPFLRWDDI